MIGKFIVDLKFGFQYLHVLDSFYDWPVFKHKMQTNPVLHEEDPHAVYSHPHHCHQYHHHHRDGLIVKPANTESQCFSAVLASLRRVSTIGFPLVMSP